MTVRITSVIVGAFALLTAPQSHGGRPHAARATRSQPATTALVGVVKTADGRPLADALVVIEGSTISTLTDSSGHFAIPRVARGLETVQLSHEGTYTLRVPDLSFATDTFHLAIQLRFERSLDSGPVTPAHPFLDNPPMFVIRGFVDSAVAMVRPGLSIAQMQMLKPIKIELFKGYEHPSFAYGPAQLPGGLIEVTVSPATK